MYDEFCGAGDKIQSAAREFRIDTVWVVVVVVWCRIVGSQQLFLAGLSLTSPLFTAVCQNLIPIFTFLLAVSFG
jgi:drug/metabolite transporter (DMT)-like permease